MDANHSNPYSKFCNKFCQNIALVVSQKNKSAHNKTFNCKDDLYCEILSLIKKKVNTTKSKTWNTTQVSQMKITQSVTCT